MQVDIIAGDVDLATALVEAGYADWVNPPAKTLVSERIAPVAPATAVPPTTATPAVSPPLHLPLAADAINVGDVLDGTIVYHARPGQFFIWKVDDDAIGLFAGVSEQLNCHFAASQPDPNFSPAVG